MPSLTVRVATCAGVALVLLAVPDGAAAERRARLSRDLEQRVRAGDPEPTTVIISGTREQVDAVAARHGLRVKKRLESGAVVEVPAGLLSSVADDGDVDLLSGNHIVRANMAVTNTAIGADQAWEGNWGEDARGVTGKGVGVVLIDSGVADVPALKKRVTLRLDFTDPKGRGLDTWGHGTHVAGIIAAEPRNKHDEVSGVAPGASLISLKVLGDDGSGYVADVIDAIEWSVRNRRRYAIKVINLSLGAPPQQSWRSDPICHAVEKAHDAGIVVVAAAGNRGRTLDGDPVYGTVDSPGHCPHALTVGVLNTMGTPWRSDDVMASYSSKGPTRDGLIKPNLVAPGHRIRGLLGPGSGIAASHPEFVIGTGGDAQLELSGTSMSAGVVSGAVALVSEDTDLSPLEVRLRLQYSAERKSAALVVEGAGRLNVLAALEQSDAHVTTIFGEPIAASQFMFVPEELTGAEYQILAGNAAVITWGNAEVITWGNAEVITWGNSHNIAWGN